MLYIVLHLNRITENMMEIIAKYAKIKPSFSVLQGAEHTIYMKDLLEKRGVPAFSSVDEWVSATEALVQVHK